MLECGMTASAIIEGKAPLAVVRGEFFFVVSAMRGACHVAVFMPFWNLRMAAWQTKWQMTKVVWQRIAPYFIIFVNFVVWYNVCLYFMRRPQGNVARPT